MVITMLQLQTQPSARKGAMPVSTNLLLIHQAMPQ